MRRIVMIVALLLLLLGCASRSLRMGMTRAELREEWGRPRDVNRTVTRYGTTEQWVYRWGNGYCYIYVENGHVVAWQD